MLITKALKKHLRKAHGLPKKATDEAIKTLVTAKLTSGELSAKTFAELTESDGKQPDPLDKLAAKLAKKMQGGSGLRGSDLFGGGTDVRVKNLSEKFSTKTYDGKHAKTGELVINPDTRKPVETLSELALAKMGALFKWHAVRAGALPADQLGDLERGLLIESAETDPWAAHAMDDGHYAIGKDVSPWQVKTLLSDTTSGGIYVNPLWFDQNIIVLPLLSGELFPFVDVVEMPRSNLINSAQFGNVNVTWGQPEGTSVQEFNTNALIGQISANVQNVMFAAEIGRDEWSDSIVDVGQYLTGRVSERFLNELDRVICIGNGATEPQGIFNSSGTLINSDNGAPGSPTVGDYEALFFGLPKERRNKNWNVAYVGNDISYRRARAIPVGPGDERRVFGMDHQTYTLLNTPYRVQQNIANNKIAAVALKRYRMWRRLGMEMRWSIEGRNLMLSNSALLTVRGRYYGQLIDPAAACFLTDAQA
jgi:HK97 family phage major capsid protein